MIGTFSSCCCVDVRKAYLQTHLSIGSPIMGEVSPAPYREGVLFGSYAGFDGTFGSYGDVIEGYYARTYPNYNNWVNQATTINLENLPSDAYTVDGYVYYADYAESYIYLYPDNQYFKFLVITKRRVIYA